MDYLKVPSNLPGFINKDTIEEVNKKGKAVYNLQGFLATQDQVHACPHCSSRMHKNQSLKTTLKHVPFGDRLSVVSFERIQYLCPNCGHTTIPEIPFKAGSYRITKPMLTYVHSLLSIGLTNMDVCRITGLNKNTVCSIDTERLEALYTVQTIDLNGTPVKVVMQPEERAEFLGIDEFKLHDGHQYATSIIDLKTGHVIWLERGKKKAVVFHFIDHVGEAWMKGVKAIACDMNSDFQEAFKARCKHVKVVFDYFHIVKNFNDKVVSEVRKDEEKRLKDAGDIKGAKSLKKTKYILTSSRETLKRKDKEADEKKMVRTASPIFGGENVSRKGGNFAKYETLIAENKLLFTIDLVKTKLKEAFECTDPKQMKENINEISDLCLGVSNPHFEWFSRLLLGHLDGIVAHATFGISTGRLEGINNKIKTIRRQAYGYHNDDYFFLKIFDASRRETPKSAESHKVEE